MEESKQSHPSLPANYVTILDLKERWMQQQNQKKRAEDEAIKVPELNFEVQDDPVAAGEDEGVGDFNKAEQKNPPSEKSVVRLNSNNRFSNRRLSHRYRRPAETSSCRWVQASKTKSAPSVDEQSMLLPVVQIAEAKALSGRCISQSKKPQPLDSPKVEAEVEPCDEINTSGRMEKAKMNMKNTKIESKVKPCGDINSSGKMEEEKKMKKTERKKKLNDGKKYDVQLQPGKDVEEIPKQGIEVGRGNIDVNDETRAEVVRESTRDVNDVNSDVDYETGAEMGGKMAGISLNSGAGESTRAKSMAVRNKRPFRKDKQGGYGRFMGRAMLKEKQGIEFGRGNNDVYGETRAEVGMSDNDVDDETGAEIEGEMAGISLNSGAGESTRVKSMAVRNKRPFRKDKQGGYGRFMGRAMLKEKKGIEVGRGNNDVDDETRAEIDGKLAGLSLNSGAWASTRGKSMAVRNQHWLRRDKEGGYGRFEDRAMLKERANRKIGSVWVKKGEAS